MTLNSEKMMIFKLGYLTVRLITCIMLSFLIYCTALKVADIYAYKTAKDSFGQSFEEKYKYYDAQMRLLMKQQGVKPLISGMKVFEMQKPNKLGTKVGETLCFGHKVVRIQLAAKYLMIANEEMVMDTIRHEVAHAIDCNRRGFSNHDEHWQEIASSLGARPAAVYK